MASSVQSVLNSDNDPTTTSVGTEEVETEPVLDVSLHSNWRVALYYIYVDVEDIQQHLVFHRELCERMGFKGRIRVSQEGINGVLTGLHAPLKEYEEILTAELNRISGMDESNPDSIDLDLKYCLLREDLPVEPQLFENLIVKETKNVISLFGHDDSANQENAHTSANKRSKQSNRRRRRKEQKQKQHQEEFPCNLEGVEEEMMKKVPSTHLSADEWNQKLSTAKNALLLDVRNVYESRVGRFSVPQVPTLLTNTRKYADLPRMLATNPHLQDTEQIYMYCTGGVRCERVSMLMQTLYPDKEIYQLQGGIQKYLRVSTEDLFKGKNFVFDPRRTDPVYFGQTLGNCLICNVIHDDYDNGHAPSENRESRCNTCRMLVLVCNSCRPNYVCWGEEKCEDRPLLYCGLNGCVHEGAAPEPELLVTEGE